MIDYDLDLRRAVPSTGKLTHRFGFDPITKLFVNVEGAAGRSSITRTSHGQLLASSESVVIHLVFALAAAAAAVAAGSAKATSALPFTKLVPPNSCATYSTPPIS